jgi:hypothetical protein
MRRNRRNNDLGRAKPFLEKSKKRIESQKGLISYEQ